jgi:hypothetical protein
MLADVARQIRQEGLFDFNLRGTEIQQIVDFQSQQGFEREDLLQQVFRGFEVLEFRTYGHLGFFPSGRAGRAQIGICAAAARVGREICFVLRVPRPREPRQHENQWMPEDAFYDHFGRPPDQACG